MNVTSYMKDLDAEILANDQQIAVLRARNYQLQETRALMMQREEERAYAANEASPFGRLPGGATVVVRDQIVHQHQLHEGEASHLAKYGIPPRLSQHTGLPLKGPRENESEEAYQRRLERDRIRSRGVQKGGRKRTYGETRRKVLEVLSGEPEGMTSSEIVNFLGARTPESKKAITNAIFNAASMGDLKKLGGPGEHAPFVITAQGEATLAKMRAGVTHRAIGMERVNGVAAHA